MKRLIIALIMLLTPATLRAQYSTTFPLTEGSISEGGNWVGGHTAGQNCSNANAGTYCWGNVQTDGTMAFGADQKNTYGDPVAILPGTWSSTQTATGVVKIKTTPTTTSNEIELHLRTTITSQSITGYEVYCSVMPSNPYCHIARWNGPYGSFCNIEPAPAPSIALVNGDTLYATISGATTTTIKTYLNGSTTPFMTATDTGQNCAPGGPAGPWTSGSPGIGFYQGLNTNWNYFGWSSFTATGGTEQTSGIYYAGSTSYADVNDCINGSGVGTCHTGSPTGTRVLFTTGRPKAPSQNWAPPRTGANSQRRAKSRRFFRNALTRSEAPALRRG